MKSSQRSFRNFAVLVLSQVVFSMAFAYLFAAKIFPVKQLAVGVIFFCNYVRNWLLACFQEYVARILEGKKMA